MRSRSAAAARAAALALALGAPPAAAQRAAADSAQLARAFALESAGKAREAAAVYRAALRPGSAGPALLGLERVYDELGWADSLVSVADAAVRAEPRDPTLRTVQLRALRAAGRRAEARGAFERWAVVAPRDPAPYRAFARILLDAQETAAADSVLHLAAIRLGGTRQLALEVAQLRGALGMWDEAAAAWRAAVDEEDFLAPAAAFSLGPAPAERRDAVRTVLAAPRATPGARRALALLEVAWGAPARGWTALGGLPPSEKAVQAWTEFGEQAEGAGAWGAARDAFAAVDAVRPNAQTAARAAGAAVRAGDAAGALALVARAEGRGDAAARAALLPVRVEALVAAGRVEEAERVAAAAGSVTPDARGRMMQSVAWGWVRAGNVARARQALAAAGDADGAETVEGWLALYAGDLRTARLRFRRADGASPALVDALAVLARTRVEVSPALGAAYLALARGDSAAAAAGFASAAPAVEGASPLLLANAARLYARTGAVDRAVPLWASIVADHPSAPEAPEADLEWARALRRAGKPREAAARLEHLIITYPESALVAQARRERESLIKSMVNGSSRSR